MLKKWSEVEVGDKFSNGSTVVRRHVEYTAVCYEIKYRKRSGFITEYGKKSCVLSEDHLLLIDISKMTLAGKQWVRDNFTGYEIPTLMDRHAYYSNLDEVLKGTMTHGELNALFGQIGLVKVEGAVALEGMKRLAPMEIRDVAVESDPSKVSEVEFWLPVRLVVDLAHMGEELLCNGHAVLSGKCLGDRRVFCVETNDHRFETCDLMHHNSVTLRNIILHCLTHGEEIAVALVDLKVTEFESYKGKKNVVAVANNVRECAEILRVMRECMYARNREMAKLGLNDIKDFRPQCPTDEVMIFNHRMKDTDQLEVKTPDGEVKIVTVKELESMLQ